MKNLILGYFYNVSSFEGIKVFIKSASDIKDRDFDVVLLDASDNNHDNTLHKFAKENNAIVKKINKELKSLYVDRFLAYKNYFLKTDYESIILCDCTDIYFQSNPFLEINNLKLVLSSENILIKDAEWNYNIIKNVYGSHLADKFLEKPVINSGIIAGVGSELEKICNLIVNEYLIYPDRCFTGVDQGLLMKVIHSNQESIDYQYAPLNFSLMMAVGLGFSNNLIERKGINIEGIRITDNEGVVYSIIHQYNRKKDLNDRVISYYESR
jgi:hypothetical protein